MNLVEVKPDTITINVDEYAEKTIPVEIVPIGKFSDDIALKIGNDCAERGNCFWS